MTEKNYNPEQKENKAMEKKIDRTKEKIDKKHFEEKTKTEDKKPKKSETKAAPKKEEVTINGTNLPISMKTGRELCKFVKWKTIDKAIEDLEQVSVKRKAVPMKGEFPHKKGMSGGKYPKKAAENFIILLKSLKGNANNHGIENPIISFAMSNKASRPYGRFGRVQKKRSHVIIKAINKKEKKK